MKIRLIQNPKLNWLFSFVLISLSCIYHAESGHWELQGGGGSDLISQNVGNYETKLEFPEGWGLKPKKPYVGGVWLFSGTTQYLQCLACLANQICKNLTNTPVGMFQKYPSHFLQCGGTHTNTVDTKLQLT